MSTSAPLRPLLATELRLHWRHGILAATALLTVLWALLLMLLPAAWSPTAVPWVLFVEVTALGFFFVPALALVERSNGVTAALRLTRLPPWRWLAVRLATLGAAALASASVVVFAAGGGPTAGVLAGTLLASILLSLIASAMIGRSDTLTRYITRVPMVAPALLMPALLHASGVWDSPLLALSPMTGAWDLLAGRGSAGAVAWLTLWIVVLAGVVARRGFDVRPSTAPAGARRQIGEAAGGHRVPGEHRTWGPVRSFARVDRITVLGDGLVLLLAAGVVVFALMVRWFGGAGVAWFDATYGVDLRPHLPVAWALVLVIHAPTMIGAVAGLLFLEDRDAGLLPVVATTRASLDTLLTYRLGSTAAVAAIAVAVGLPVAGARPGAGLVGGLATVMVAGGVAVVPALLLATVARDRVQGMALFKVLGLPLYVPLAWWFVDGPAGWLFGISPTGWAARTLWADTAAGAAGYAAVGLTLVGALIAALVPRYRRSVLG